MSRRSWRFTLFLCLKKPELLQWCFLAVQIYNKLCSYVDRDRSILSFEFYRSDHHLILLLQPLRWRCVDCVIHHKWDVHKEQQYIYIYIYVVRTSNNKVIVARDLYCCLLPQCEALRTCRSGFRLQLNGAVTRMWKSCRVKPSRKERAISAVRFKKKGMLLQPLQWLCVDCVIHHERDVHEEQQYIYEWHEQAIIE